MHNAGASILNHTPEHGLPGIVSDDTYDKHALRKHQCNRKV